jgi:hypothetical protein
MPEYLKWAKNIEAQELNGIRLIEMSEDAAHLSHNQIPSHAA